MDINLLLGNDPLIKNLQGNQVLIIELLTAPLHSFKQLGKIDIISLSYIVHSK